MNIFAINNPKDKGLQLLFRDDESFEFRKLSLEDSCLVEKGTDQLPMRGWKHFFSTQLSFRGFKNITAGPVTISCMRDFIMDPFNQIPETASPSEGGKPKSSSDNDIRKWTARIAEQKRYQVTSKRPNQAIIDKMIWFLGAGLIIELIIWGIIMGTKAH